MNISKQMLFISLIATAISTEIYCMNYARKIASVIGTAVHCGLAGGMVYEGYKQYTFRAMFDELLEKNTVDASDDIKGLVYEVVTREGMDPETIKVRIENGEYSLYSAAHNNTILINAEEAWKLSTCLNNLKRFNDAKQEIIKDHGQGCFSGTSWYAGEYILRAKAHITHEAHHLKHNDPATRIAAQFIIPAATFLASRYTPILNVLYKNIFTKIVSGAALYESNALLNAAFIRMQESRADDGITERGEMLAFHKDLLTNILKYPQRPSIYDQLHENHPSDSDRMARVYSRLQDNKPLKPQD